ncbi:hypothetical protein ARTSIC4J27_2408 [Pseudarthrobacter siccitolerans]|uniref:Uncharacterized protein n=1 Tax=Pseudarthrobacter siccitolerans TaxID=861266 RepID=A0A024H2P1_9MICC|nr:hypothetical protein ARTSIC4J27_2408 [Pseudarthrobacter siccitolerans]
MWIVSRSGDHHFRVLTWRRSAADCRVILIACVQMRTKAMHT